MCVAWDVPSFWVWLADSGAAVLHACVGLYGRSVQSGNEALVSLPGYQQLCEDGLHQLVEMLEVSCRRKDLVGGLHVTRRHPFMGPLAAQRCCSCRGYFEVEL